MSRYKEPMRLLAIALVACHGSPSETKAPPPSPKADAVVAIDAAVRSPILDATAAKLDAAATQLRDVHALVSLETAVTALHATDKWKKQSKRSMAYRPLAPAQVHTVIADLVALADQFADSASRLRSNLLADAMERLRVKVDETYAHGLGTLSSDAVGELVFVRDHVCTKDDSRCADISAGFDAAVEIAKRVRAALNGAATDLEAVPGLDQHATVVLSRTLGKGPRYGEACGPEDLCAWDLECMKETRTCEHACFEGAMQPCPPRLMCTHVPKLTGTVCR